MLVRPDERRPLAVYRGHTGFKGAWLCHWLVNLGAEVSGFALEPQAFAPTTSHGRSIGSHSPHLFAGLALAQRTNTVIGDISSADAINRCIRDTQPEVVFHLAAQALVRPGYLDPAKTYATNVMGTVNLLEAVRNSAAPCRIVVITSDKCYLNQESMTPYTEQDALGGADPYSASKACADIVALSYQQSYFANDASEVHLATARAGNVVGGGDWAQDRIVPDVVRAWLAEAPLAIRNPDAIRPWQHVLEPLSGYLALAEQLTSQSAARAWNFGPNTKEIASVAEVIHRLRQHWPEISIESPASVGPNEAGILLLDSSEARQKLNWSPRWNLEETLARTLAWYEAWETGADPIDVTTAQIEDYCSL